MSFSRCLVLTIAIACLAYLTPQAQRNTYSTNLSFNGFRPVDVVTVDEGENIYLCGLSDNGRDLQVARTDSLGNVDWIMNYSASGREEILAAQGLQNGMVGVGRLTDPEGQSWPMAFELDCDGQMVWQQVYRGGGTGYFTSVTPTSDGGFLVGGQAGTLGCLFKLASQGEAEWGHLLLRSIQNPDGIGVAVAEPKPGEYAVLVDYFMNREAGLFRFNQDGATLSERHLHSASGQLDLEAMAATPDGGLIISGGDGNVVLIKVNAQDEVEWQYSYNISTSFIDVKVLPEGHFLCLEKEIGSNPPGLWLMGSEGEVGEGEAIQTQIGNLARQLDLASSGAVYVIGSLNPFFGSTISRTDVHRTGFCHRWDRWADRNPFNLEPPLPMIVSPLPNPAGRDEASQTLSLSLRTNALMQGEICRTAYEVAPQLGIDLTAYPQPANGPIQLHVEGPSEEEIQIEVFDPQGRLVQIKLLSRHCSDLTILEREVPAGCYVLKATSESGVTHRQKVLRLD